ncbi:MAG: hypothetical protein IPG50_35140 [Myxococcales bacterium]|nr:hypothetical protein [Myxococcales bacterium]
MLRWSALAVVGALVVGCSATGASADSESGAITDRVPVAVRDQRETGNCWLFATAAWIEHHETLALRERAPDAVAEPLSVAYLDYWDWYEKITRGRLVGEAARDLVDELDSGGTWGAATELVLKYGVVRRRDFHGFGGQGAATKDATSVERAKKALATSLANGALRTEASRQNGALVRRELDAAFELSDRTSRAITEVFGKDGATNFTSGAAAALPIGSPKELLVAAPKPDGSRPVVALTELIGKRARGGNPDVRTGAHAWTSVPFTANSARETRVFFRRIQRALHAGAALPFAWFYPSNADADGSGEFRSVPEEPGDDVESVEHETLMVDYEADGVPGFGALKAGAAASPEAREAALHDDTKIRFFRAVDSYGVLHEGRRRDTSDLYVDYLLGEFVTCPKGVMPPSRHCEKHRGFVEVTLPNGF